jgi:hypothetical protein
VHPWELVEKSVLFRKKGLDLGEGLDDGGIPRTETLNNRITMKKRILQIAGLLAIASTALLCHADLDIMEAIRLAEKKDRLVDWNDNRNLIVYKVEMHEDDKGFFVYVREPSNQQYMTMPPIKVSDDYYRYNFRVTIEGVINLVSIKKAEVIPAKPAVDERPVWDD